MSTLLPASARWGQKSFSLEKATPSGPIAKVKIALSDKSTERKTKTIKTGDRNADHIADLVKKTYGNSKWLDQWSFESDAKLTATSKLSILFPKGKMVGSLVGDVRSDVNAIKSLVDKIIPATKKFNRDLETLIPLFKKAEKASRSGDYTEKGKIEKEIQAKFKEFKNPADTFSAIQLKTAIVCLVNDRDFEFTVDAKSPVGEFFNSLNRAETEAVANLVTDLCKITSELHASSKTINFGPDLDSLSEDVYDFIDSERFLPIFTAMRAAGGNFDRSGESMINTSWMMVDSLINALLEVLRLNHA